MDTPRWLNETEMRAWTGFLETGSLMARLVDAQLRGDGGLTQVQYEILTRVHEGPRSRRRMTELADLMVCSRSGLTYQVAQLEKSGLLRRETDPEDERGILAVLTKAGRELLEATAPGHLDIVRQGLIDVLTPEQVAQLATIMDAARRHLREIVAIHPPRPGKAPAAH